MTRADVTLAPASRADFPAFKRELQAAFAVAVVEEMGELPEGPIPSDAELDRALSAPGAVVRTSCKVGAEWAERW